MGDSLFDFPDLRERDIQNCRLLISRDKILEYLPKNGIVAEVGVGIGGFAETILRVLEPKEFHCIDTFAIPRDWMLWGKPTNEIFGDNDHYGFFIKKFHEQIDSKVIHIKKGISWEILSTYPDQYFDFIYIDAGHDYNSVKRDASEAARKIKENGIICFNDYIMYDHFSNVTYGVIPVVHELCVNEDFEILYLALQKYMFCDVALGRRRRS